MNRHNDLPKELLAVFEVSTPKIEESARYQEPLADSTWRSIWWALKGQLRYLDRARVSDWVKAIRAGLQWLDTPMERYCEATWPTCEDSCCDGKKIFFNQADLLYLTAQQGVFVPGQTRERSGDPCRYLKSAGCQLPRIYRPYVCVWFLCDQQMRLLNAETTRFQRQFIYVYHALRRCRLQLEALYEANCNPPL